jgi:hypothetical protein
MAAQDPLTNREFVTPSGRRWKVSEPSRFDRNGTRYLRPLGDDTYSGGGVRGLYVAVERLDGNDKVWRPA